MIGKPFTFEELGERIRAILDRKSTAIASGRPRLHTKP
jgi:DNA-binding response OmpR family regulator